MAQAPRRNRFLQNLHTVGDWLVFKTDLKKLCQRFTPFSNSFCVLRMGWVRRVRKQPVNVTLFVNGFPVLVYFGIFQCNGLIAYRAQHDRLQGSYWQNFLSNRERDFKHNLPDF
jgi:hypothetical protein